MQYFSLKKSFPSEMWLCGIIQLVLSKTTCTSSQSLFILNDFVCVCVFSGFFFYVRIYWRNALNWFMTESVSNHFFFRFFLIDLMTYFNTQTNLASKHMLIKHTQKKNENCFLSFNCFYFIFIMFIECVPKRYYIK